MRAILATLIFCLFATMANAHTRHHRYHHVHAYHDVGSRPSAWCGWYMRQIMGVADAAFNLAANWAHWGHAAGGPHVGAVVVWPHHVGRIVGRSGGEWVVNSGNDGHRVRTRPRSLAGAIAFREI